MPPKGRQAAAKTKVRRKEKKNVAVGQAHIKSTFNNTIISITDPGTPDARLSENFHSILRLQFFDAVPADEYLPAPHGLFDRIMAREVSAFVQGLGGSEHPIGLLVHCEYGISRSAAVALFVEAWSGAPLEAREFACEANEWVIDRLLDLHPEIEIEIPPKTAIHDRRAKPRLS